MRSGYRGYALYTRMVGKWLEAVKVEGSERSGESIIMKVCSDLGPQTICSNAQTQTVLYAFLLFLLFLLKNNYPTPLTSWNGLITFMLQHFRQTIMEKFDSATADQLFEDTQVGVG